jgi:hypothetical protein
MARELGLLHPHVTEVLHDAQSTHLFPDGRNFANGHIITLQTSFFRTTFCERAKHVFHMRVCSTAVTSGQGTILNAIRERGSQVRFSVRIWLRT